MADSGKLTYSLGLNTASFVGLMRQAIGMVLSYKAVMMTLRGIGRAFDLSEELQDLRGETGEAVGDLLVMKQAFEDCGLGAGELQNSLRYMRRSLTGISEMGQRTEEVFAALGLDLASLRGRDAISQFEAVGRAIGGLATQEDRVNAAMTIFGRSGAGMLRIFGNPQAFQEARAALGSMPEIMEKYSAQMDKIRDGWGRIRTAITGAFAGAIGPALPMLDQITQKINSIDFAKIGAGLAAAFGAFKDVFISINPREFAVALANVVFVALGSAVRESFAILFKPDLWIGVGKMLLGAFAGLGAALIDAFAPVVAFLAAGIDQVVDALFVALSKIPKYGEQFRGRKDLSFDEHYQSELSSQRNGLVTPAQETAAEFFVSGSALFGRTLLDAGKGIAESISNSAGEQYFAGLGSQFGEEFSSRMSDILSESRKDSRAGSTEPASSAGGPSGSPYETPADRWSRVGAFVGGSIGAQSLDVARRTNALVAKISGAVVRMVPAMGRLEPAVL